MLFNTLPFFAVCGPHPAPPTGCIVKAEVLCVLPEARREGGGLTWAVPRFSSVAYSPAAAFMGSPFLILSCGSPENGIPGDFTLVKPWEGGGGFCSKFSFAFLWASYLCCQSASPKNEERYY